MQITETAAEDENDRVSWLELNASSQIISWTHERSLREDGKTLPRILENEDEVSILSAPKSEAGIGVGERIKRCATLAMNLRKAQVNDVLKKMQDARRLDLCFLVDVTGSMTAHIRAVKESIRSIVGKLTTKPTIRTQSIVQQVCDCIKIFL